MAADQWLIWQLADSAFPAGGLAHSNGLEAAVQCGFVTDPAGVEAFVRTTVRQCQRGPLGFVRATHTAPNDFLRIDRQCDLFLNNHVSNRASRTQGHAFLAATVRIFASKPLIQFSDLVRSSGSPTHLAPVFGTVLGLLEVKPALTRDLFVFILVRSCIGSAVRLGIVGPLEAQRIQSRVRADQFEPDSPPVQTAPVLDLLQGTQDRLYSRLFQS